jgi:iron complex outermembrane recepter protein
MPAINSRRFFAWVSPQALLACTVMGAAALFATSVGATDANSADTEAVPKGGLEEIVVTATRREENINHVPISVTAFNQEMIDQKGIKDIQDVVRFTPGISIDTSGTNAISIRGISSSAGAGTTGIYIDDTPIQMRASGFNPDDTLPKTFDLDRVEVLRGPQGTLFGSGSEGGTVRYIMNQPSVTQESTYARAEVSYTKSGQPSGEIGLAHGGPIIDDVLGFRASVWYRYDGGWIDRVDPGTLDPTTAPITEKNANHANTIAARIALLIQPMDALKITPSFTYQNSRKHDTSTFWPAYSNQDNGTFNNATPERIPDPDEYYLGAIKLEANLGFATLISNTSYFHRNELTGYQGTAFDLSYFQSLAWSGDTGGLGLGCNGGGAPPCSWYPLLDGNGIHTNTPGYVTPNTITNQQRNWSEEIRLQSNDDGSSRFKWTVGVFWSLAEQISIEDLQDPQITNFFSSLYDGYLPSDVYGSFYNCPSDPDNSTPQTQFPFPDCSIYYNYNKTHDRQIAGFGEATFRVTDQLSVTGGLRYAKLSGDLTHYANGLENYGPYGTGALDDPGYPAVVTGSYQEHSLTPKGTVSFQLDQQNLFYFTYAKGFRPGGFNPSLPPFCADGLIAQGYSSGQAPLQYGSDTTQSFEVGSKNSFSNMFRVQASAYYIKWNDIQQNVYIGGSCALQFSDNLGTAVSKGFDLQADLALGHGISVEASVGYTDSRFTQTVQKTPESSTLVRSGDAVPGEAGINYAPGTTPPWTVAIGPQYDFDLAGHKSFVRLDWEYTSRNNWLSPVQDPLADGQYNQGYSYTLPSTSFTSMRAGMNFGDLGISAFCDNLFDSHTTINYAFAQLDYSNPNGPPSPQENRWSFRPRTVGLTFTYRH